jgi:hypothetical protein
VANVAAGTALPPAAQQAGDCQQLQCDGSGHVVSQAAPADVPPPADTVCETNPSCSGSPLAPTYTQAAAGTSCAADNKAPNHVCGTPGTAAGGTCVECNVSADCAAACPPGATCSCATNRCSATFAFSGAAQPFTVPAGVTQVTIAAYGAAGGGSTCRGSSAGGNGGLTLATVPVTPGETLTVTVGGYGDCQLIGGVITQVAGFNGGGLGGSGGYGTGAAGGGASDVRRGSGLANRIIVAGGGGGGGSYGGPFGGVGGVGGTTTGGTGATGMPSGALAGGVGGSGGTQTAGGAGGTGVVNGDPGTLGVGGAGHIMSGFGSGGGGGGGGYYGGGAGGSVVSGPGAGGGGGGSSYVDPSATGVSMMAGVQPQNGKVVITW